MRKPSEFTSHPMSHVESVQRGVLRAVCKYVTDGDTFDMLISLGMDQYSYATIRLHDLDTPEIFHPSNKAELEHGQAAKARVAGSILDRPVLLKTFRDAETFGRYVADVSYFNGNSAWLSLAYMLRSEGFEKRAAYPPDGATP